MDMNMTIHDYELKNLSAYQRREIRDGATSIRRSDPSEMKDKQVMKACQDFESIFITHLFKTMRNAYEDDSGLFGKSMGGDFFRDVFEGEVARKVSATGGIGLADMLYKSMTRYRQVVTEGQIETSTARSSPILRSSDPTFRRVQTFHRDVMRASQQYDVEPAMLYAIISQESGGDPNVVSSKGAKGLMQLMDGTAAEVGVRNSFDPADNISGGAHYFRKMLDRFDGNVRMALAAYNAGPGTVERYGGIPPYEETMNYVERVMEYHRRYKGMMPEKSMQLV